MELLDHELHATSSNSMEFHGASHLLLPAPLLPLLAPFLPPLLADVLPLFPAFTEVFVALRVPGQPFPLLGVGSQEGAGLGVGPGVQGALARPAAEFAQPVQVPVRAHV